jgi:homopolymeric O-antigen transport system ATP-binding protein
MRFVRVVNTDGRTVEAVDVRQPVGIEIGFTVLREGEPVLPKIKVYDKNGDVAFNAMDIDGRWEEPTPPGDYAATAWIPANLLNEGLTSVDVGIMSLAAPKLHPHTGAYDAVSFHVQDPGEGDSARGQFTGQWKGVVRPLLEWTVEER